MSKIKFTAYFWKCPTCGGKKSLNYKFAPTCNAGITDGHYQQHAPVKMDPIGKLACEARVEITVLPPEE